MPSMWLTSTGAAPTAGRSACAPPTGAGRCRARIARRCANAWASDRRHPPGGRHAIRQPGMLFRPETVAILVVFGIITLAADFPISWTRENRHGGVPSPYARLRAYPGHGWRAWIEPGQGGRPGPDRRGFAGRRADLFDLRPARRPDTGRWR